MPRKRKDIESALSKKGFRPQNKHHKYYYFYDGDTFTGIYTYISTGNKYKDYGDALLSKMAKQLKLNSRKELCELVDCSMDQAKYRGKLEKQGLVKKAAKNN